MKYDLYGRIEILIIGGSEGLSTEIGFDMLGAFRRENYSSAKLFDDLIGVSRLNLSINYVPKFVSISTEYPGVRKFTDPDSDP